jgi:hypothetical protein
MQDEEIRYKTDHGGGDQDLSVTQSITAVRKAWRPLADPPSTLSNTQSQSSGMGSTNGPAVVTAALGTRISTPPTSSFTRVASPNVASRSLTSIGTANARHPIRTDLARGRLGLLAVPDDDDDAHSFVGQGFSNAEALFLKSHR